MEGQEHTQMIGTGYFLDVFFIKRIFVCAQLLQVKPMSKFSKTKQKNVSCLYSFCILGRDIEKRRDKYMRRRKNMWGNGVDEGDEDIQI